MVDFNAYRSGNYGLYGGYGQYGPAYGGYDYLLKAFDDTNKGSLYQKMNSLKQEEKGGMSTGAKIGIAAAIGTAIALTLTGKWPAVIKTIKKPFTEGKIGEWTAKIFKKAPKVAAEVVEKAPTAVA